MATELTTVADDLVVIHTADGDGVAVRRYEGLAPDTAFTFDGVEALLQQQRLVGGASHGAALADAVSRLCGEPLQRLQREVRRTLEYLGSHRRHLAPKGIVLLGGGATIAGAAPWLTGGGDCQAAVCLR